MGKQNTANDLNLKTTIAVDRWKETVIDQNEGRFVGESGRRTRPKERSLVMRARVTQRTRERKINRREGVCEADGPEETELRNDLLKIRANSPRTKTVQFSPRSVLCLFYTIYII